MELHFKITIYLLLLVHTSHLVWLQNSTDSPRPTMDKSWLREQSSDAEEEEQNKPGGDVSPMEPSNDGSNVTYNGDNRIDRDEPSENKTSNDVPVAITTEPPTSSHAPEEQPELPNGTGNSENRESSHTNITVNEDFDNLTTPSLATANHLINDSFTTNPDVDNLTTPSLATAHRLINDSFIHPDISNRTNIESTTLLPKMNNPTENTTAGNDAEPNNVTESATTTVTTTLTTTKDKTSTTSSPTVLPLPDPTKLLPEVTTTVAAETALVNLTDKQASSGSISERGFSSKASKTKRNEAWGAVLGTAVVVSIVGLVAYIILKRKHQKGFSHSKLVEVFPADPVLRLDNSDPLDLNFGGSAYYNPGLQGDSIQMSNIPGRKKI